MKNNHFIRLAFILITGIFLLFHSEFASCQTNIGGIINIYTPVLSIDTTSCPPNITVQNSAGFVIGDNVIIIQMKGADFDTSNTSSFGTLLNLNGAGNYEIAKIISVNSSVIRLNGKLINNYSVSGHVQLVRIPSYNDVTVTSTLTCQPWDGATGGILIFKANDHLELQADIDATGTGFRGGSTSMNPDGGCGSGSTSYYYPLIQPGATYWIQGGAEKGEGICEIDSNRLAGQGPLINGGGGGNKHNTGGGGGGNFTNGGVGGNELTGCTILNNAGIGGHNLSTSYLNNKLFAGGGGGCGDYNNGVGSNGQNGGGIVIILASSISGNNHFIKANGNDVTIVGSGIADGAGGGGAGGVVYIRTNNTVSPYTVQANGGKGGDQNPTYGCVGTGGGGGTGAILINMNSMNNITTSMLPGAAGLFLTPSFVCYNTTYGAAPGDTTITGALTNMNLLFTKDSTISCGVTGIQQTKAIVNSYLSLFPNPASTTIFWNLFSENKNIKGVIIYDVLGKTVYESPSKNYQVNKSYELNIENFSKGAYIIEIRTENNYVRGRFVKY